MDIIGIRGFYASPLGIALRKRLRALIAHAVHLQADDLILGVGYATPLLRPLLDEGRRVIALMPEAQGAIYWPVEGDNRCVLVDSGHWPLHTHAAQHILMMHALEHVSYPADMLREAWRVLSPGGKLWLIIPRRFGTWRWLGHTPLRSVRAPATRELMQLMRQAGFTWVHARSCCVMPPLQHSFFSRFWRMLDMLLSVVIPCAASLRIIEAEKQIYAAITDKASVKLRSAALVPSAASAFSEG